MSAMKRKAAELESVKMNVVSGPAGMKRRAKESGAVLGPSKSEDLGSAKMNVVSGPSGKKHRILSNIYENSSTFSGYIQKVIGSGPEAEEFALELLGITGYGNYSNYLSYLEKIYPPYIVSKLKKPSPLNHIKNIEIMFDNRNMLRIETSKLLTKKELLGSFISWELIKERLDIQQNLSEYCEGFVQRFKLEKPESDEPQGLFESIMNFFRGGDMDDKIILRGKYYIYVLVQEKNGEYYLYLAGPCSDKDCHKITRLCNGILLKFEISHSDIYKDEGDIIMAGEFKPIYQEGKLVLLRINNDSGHYRPSDIEQGDLETLMAICDQHFGCKEVEFLNFKKGGSKKHKKKRKNNKKTKRRKPRSKIRSKKSKTKRIRKIR